MTPIRIIAGDEHSYASNERLPTVSAGVVLIADDHSTVAEALALALASRGLTAETTDDLRVDHLVRTVASVRPTVVTLDLYHGFGEPTTVAAIPPIRRLGASVVVLTGSTRDADAAAALAAGAAAVVHKGAALGDALEVIAAVARDSDPDPAAPASPPVQAPRDAALARVASLSRRETHVLTALARGATAAEIAAANHVAIATVRSQIHAVLTKLGVRSQLAAVHLAHEAGLVRTATKVTDTIINFVDAGLAPPLVRSTRATGGAGGC